MADFNLPMLGSTLTKQQRPQNDDPSAQLVQDFRKTLSELSQLWDQIHLEPAVREARIQQACELVRDMLNQVVNSEERMVQELAANLEVRRKAVTDLRTLFNQPPFDESNYPQGSIVLLKALDAEMNQLVKKRKDALAKQLELFEKYGMLCHRLGKEPENIGSVEDRIFTDQEINELSDKVTKLKATFSKRLDKAFQLQNEAKKIFDTINLPANNSIGEDELHYLKLDLQNHNVVLTAELMNKFTAINQRLKDYHDAWIEQVAFRYDELIVKLDELSEKCFRPPVSRDHPSHTNYEQLNEKELENLEEQLRKRQELYDRAQPVFDKLREWMDCWKQKLDTERRVCRASFYKNRAGVLNTKLKQRKMLETKVPRLFNELHELCEEYIKHNRVFDILVDGARADKYAERVMAAYEEDREMHRVQRQISNSKIPQTPGRHCQEMGRTRNVFATTTISRTPMRQINTKTPPATVGSRPRKRSFSCSQLSAILPVKSPATGPRCSSPKQWRDS